MSFTLIPDIIIMKQKAFQIPTKFVIIVGEKIALSICTSPILDRI